MIKLAFLCAIAMHGSGTVTDKSWNAANATCMDLGAYEYRMELIAESSESMENFSLYHSDEIVNR